MDRTPPTGASPATAGRTSDVDTTMGDAHERTGQERWGMVDRGRRGCRHGARGRIRLRLGRACGGIRRRHRRRVLLTRR